LEINNKLNPDFIPHSKPTLGAEEIRAVTGLKLGTVRSRINRARNHFRRIIEPMLELELPEAEDREP